MNEYALIINNVFQEVRLFDEQPVDIPHKQIKWLPVVREVADHDDIIIEATQVRILKNVPTALVKVKTHTLVQRVAAKGDTFSKAVIALLDADPVVKMRFLTISEIDVNDPVARSFITRAGMDPDEILAPE